MTDLLYKIKHNISVPILLFLNLIIAFYVVLNNGYIALNPVYPGGSNSMLLAWVLELVTSGLLFIYLVMIFLPKHRISSLIFDSLLVATQLAILIGVTLLDGNPFLQSATFLVCSLALVTLIDRIFDIIVLGIASREKKEITVIELPGSDSNV